MQLNSKTLLLKKITTNDLNNYLLLVTNKEIMHFITGEPLSHKNGITKFETIIQENSSATTFGHFLVSLVSTKQFIGYAKLVETSPKCFELGYMFLPDYWRKGFGKEVSEVITRHAKTIPEIEKIIAIIDPENTASKKILINSGFHLHKICTMDGLPAGIYHLKL